jgi:hypothetical protein
MMPSPPILLRPFLIPGAPYLAMAGAICPLHSTAAHILHSDDGLRQYRFWIGQLSWMLRACWQPHMVKSNENESTIIQFRA